MARNEIRLRKKSMSAGHLARYRNYEHLMARHERDARIKRLSRFIVYILIAVIMICTFLAFYIIHSKNSRQHPAKPVQQSYRHSPTTSPRFSNLYRSV